MSWQFVGNPVKYNNITMLPNSMDPHGAHFCRQHIKNFHPDVLWVLADIWMTPFFSKEYSHYRDDFKGFTVKKGEYPQLKRDVGYTSIYYYPLDGWPVPLHCTEIVEQFDYLVAMSKFGQEESKRVGWDEYSQGGVRYIPHGCDINNFYPFNEDEKAKIRKKVSVKMYEDKELTVDLTDKFVVGFVGRNQPRKMVGELVKAFDIFREGKKDVVLYLKTDPRDQAGCDLYDLQKRHGLEKLVYYDLSHSFIYGFPQHQMASIYNLFDIHVSPTTGEGFGLTTQEAAACGIPNIITDYTTAQELLKTEYGPAGILTKPACMITGTLNVERAMPDKYALADAMEKYYKNPNLIKKHGENGRKHMANYTWDKIGASWIELFKEIEEFRRGKKK